MKKSRITQTDVTRRELLAGTAAALGGVLVSGTPARLLVAHATPGTPPTAAPTSAVGARSAFAPPVPRAPVGELTGNSLTPLQALTGTITPSDLHFERHHAGVPAIDPKRHRLLIHGLVERPLEFTLDDLARFPQVTRTHFIECSGNGRGAYRAPAEAMTPQ